MKGQAAFRLLPSAFRLLPSVRGAVVTWRCLSFIHSLLHAFIHVMNIGEGLSYHVLMITMMAVASLYSFLCVSGCSVVKMCPTLSDPVGYSMPGFSVPSSCPLNR